MTDNPPDLILKNWIMLKVRLHASYATRTPFLFHCKYVDKSTYTNALVYSSCRHEITGKPLTVLSPSNLCTSERDVMMTLHVSML